MGPEVAFRARLRAGSSAFRAPDLTHFRTDSTWNREEKATAVAEISAELEVRRRDLRRRLSRHLGAAGRRAARKLREADASFSVVKNRLAKRATDGAGAGDARRAPGRADRPDLRPRRRGPRREGDRRLHQGEACSPTRAGSWTVPPWLPTSSARSPASPAWTSLRGQLVGVAASPLTGIVRTLNQLIAGLASQLGQVAEQGLVSGEEPAEPEAGRCGRKLQPRTRPRPRSPRRNRPTIRDFRDRRLSENRRH